MYADARIPAALLLILGTPVFAQSEIYRCALDDGTVAFQQTPCVAAEEQSAAGTGDTGQAEEDLADAAAPGDAVPDENVVFAEPDDAPATVPAETPAVISEDRANCEKAARDAIDAIELEMRKGYSPEQGLEYRDELLELTRELRACKERP